MKKNVKISSSLILLALAVSACSSTPVSEVNTTPVASIPESGTLTTPPSMTTTPVSNNNNYGGTNTTSYTPAPDYTTPTYTPPATQPPVTTAPTYTPPATTQPPATTTTYDYAGGNNNSAGSSSYYDSYTGYGTPKFKNYSGNSNAASGSYQSYGGNSAGSSVGGSYAVQILASGSSSKAESVKQQMKALGLSAVVDPVGGLYKVRIPFASKAEAQSSLMRIRSMSGESGAFVTTR